MSCNLAAHAALRALSHPHPKLNVTDRAVFAEMVYRANGVHVCYKSVEHFMRTLNIGTRQTVCAATKKLREHGLIEVKRRFRDSNHYVILDPDGYLYGDWAAAADVKETAHLDVTDVKETAHVDVKETAHGEGDTCKENRTTDVKKTAQESVPQESTQERKIPKEGRSRVRAPEADGTDDLLTIVQAWNAMTKHSGIAPVRSLTDKRKARLRARLHDHGLPGVLEGIDRIGASAFCRGDNPRGWRADFDFLLQEQSLTRTLEGRYDARKPVSSIDQLHAAIDAEFDAMSDEPMTIEGRIAA